MPRVGRVLILAISLALAGCQAADDGALPSNETAAETTNQTTSTESDATAPPRADAAVELGSGSFDFLDPRAGLTDLASFQQTLVITFSGSRHGQGHEWTKTYTYRRVAEPFASILTVETSGGISPSDPAIVAEASGALYLSFSDGTCTGAPILPESPLAPHEPAALISGLLGVEEVGPEDTNGVPAIRYAFDERAMAESGRAETNGELWLAAEGGQLLKYLRTTTADAAYFGDDVEGTASWTYELTDLNGVSDIGIPTGCQVNAPSLPDATNLLVLPQAMGFETTASLAEVTAFYQEHLPALGWSIAGEPLVGEGTIVSVYEVDGRRLNVIVMAMESSTRVDILVSQE